MTKFKIIIENFLLEQNFKQAKLKFGGNLAQIVGDKLDPSPTKKYTYKLCQFITDHNDINDNNFNTKLFDLITEFDKYNGNLIKKDINQYESPEELEKILVDYKKNIDPRKLAKKISKNSKENILDENEWGKLVLVSTFNDAAKYSGYCNWCITKEKTYFNDYTNNNTHAIFVFMLKHDFENINSNEDSAIWENSMVALRYWYDGRITYTNRANNGDDNADIENLMKISGLNIENVAPKVMKVLNDYRAKVDEKLEFLTNESLHGRSVLEFVDEHYRLPNGYVQVNFNQKYNITTPSGVLISPNQWFDNVLKLNDDLITIEKDDKYNVMDYKGTIISPNQWFDKISVYSNDSKWIVIKNNNVYNFMDMSGRILYPKQWFTDIKYNNIKNQIIVNIDGYFNILLLNENTYMFKEWFDYVSGEYYYYIVKRTSDHLSNLVNKNGRFMFDEWYNGIKMQDTNTGVILDNNEIKSIFYIKDDKPYIIKKNE